MGAFEDSGYITLAGISIVGLFYAVLPTAYRYSVQLPIQRRLTLLDDCTIGTACVVLIVGVVATLTDNNKDQPPVAPDMDSYAQTLITTACILSKLSMSFSVWPFIEHNAILKTFMIFQIVILCFTYPLFMLVMPSVCQQSEWFPLFADYQNCNDDAHPHFFEWGRIAFEIWCPLVLIAMPIIAARVLRSSRILKKPLIIVSVLTTAYESLSLSPSTSLVFANDPLSVGCLAFAREFMSQEFRYDKNYVPEIVITIVSVALPDRSEASLGILTANLLPIMMRDTEVITPFGRLRRCLCGGAPQPENDDESNNENDNWIPLQRVPRAHTNPNSTLVRVTV
ncbi:hypothetical protein F4811DRAFT_549558 [Daldinia bambusicola]|nr:hypothetical protein F4811DRAFT_549558 [Daldinia bambusicola]